MKWLPVPGYEKHYEVSDEGLVRTVDGRIVKQWLNDQGYSLIRVSGPRAVLRVHRVVAEAFIGNPGSLPFVNHIAYAAAREAAATAALRAELDLRRKSGSAVDRLHNLCEGIAESADGSEWSREEWERIDAENAELRAAVERVRGVLEAAQNDAMRFRWLTEDHADPETRAKCRDLLSRMGVMTYSAACRDIDSAMAQATKREMLRTAVEWQRRYEPTCAHGRYSDEDCADCPRTAEAAARAELGGKA